MTLAKRLTRIETSLTPKQAVLLWLKEAQELDPNEFDEKVLKCPMHEAPRVRIPEMAEKAVRDSLSKKGLKPESISEAALEAWKGADSMLVLVYLLNEEIVQDARVSTPCLRLLLVRAGMDGRKTPGAWPIYRVGRVESAVHKHDDPYAFVKGHH